MVTHEHYRAIGNNQDARDYFREAKRRQRAKEEGLSKTVKDNLGQSKTPASVYASDSGTEQEGGCKGGCERNANASDTHKPSLCSPQPQPEPDIQKPETMKKDVVLSDFEEAWKAYPSKTGSKTTSEKAYRRYRKDGDAQVDILAGIDRYKRHVEAQRIGGFALNWQNGQTFFNGAGWRSSWTTEAFKLVPGQPSAEWETAKKQIAELVWTARDAERAGDKDAITRAIKTCRDKYRDVPKRGDSHVVTVAVELAMNNSRR